MNIKRIKRELLLLQKYITFIEENNKYIFNFNTSLKFIHFYLITVAICVYYTNTRCARHLPNRKSAFYLHIIFYTRCTSVYVTEVVLLRAP